jgi:hypothetical protein
MDLKSRVQGILLKPKEEWETIKAETYPISQLFTSYVMILVAVPAVAQFIGYWLIGYRVPFYGLFRFGLGTAFFRAIFFYVLTLVSVYVLGIVINALAKTFDSKSDPLAAMKLAVFSLTPGWVAGALYLIPTLGILVSLAALYGIYLMYLGLSAGLMETPKEKVVTYLVVVIVVTIVIWVVIGLILGTVFAVGVGVSAI